MATIQYEVLEALRAIGVPEGQAARAAEALASGDTRRLDSIDTRLDKIDTRLDKIETGVTALKDIVGLTKADLAITRWTLAGISAGIFAIVVRLH